MDRPNPAEVAAISRDVPFLMKLAERICPGPDPTPAEARIIEALVTVCRAAEAYRIDQRTAAMVEARTRGFP